MTAQVEATADNHDWLGYQVYADTLWDRVCAALAVAAPTEASPRGDPLVVGIFGEWGSGKSKLLQLMYDLARQQNARDCVARAIGRTKVSLEDDTPITLLVPVWFHPWKYEHEPYLAIPLLMHLADALSATLKESRTISEKAISYFEQLGVSGRANIKQVTDAVEAVANQRECFERMLDMAGKVASNQMFRAIVGFSAGCLGFGNLADKALDSIAETALELTGVDDDSTPRKRDSTARGSPIAEARTSHGSAVPVPTADGRYYYNLHQYLAGLTRQKRCSSLNEHSEVLFSVNINFVVFIDDLDRCLPEKSVEVLEVIKTLFNVESFAFVLALDDEVIERGISHRYRDYRLAGKKPEMPITGFEYLEKIIHLPFRLPQLTRRQALFFLERTEASLVPDSDARMLFPPVLKHLEGLGQREAVHAPDVGRLASPKAASQAVAENLRDLLLGSLDIYIPRKLVRAVELWTQVTRLAQRRNFRLGNGAAIGQLDARVLMALVIFQLFQPEIYRQLRRCPATLPSLIDAFAKNELRSTTPATVDLYRWAAYQPDDTDSSSARDAPIASQVPHSDQDWRNVISRLPAEQRYSAEHVRLPMIDLLREHRLTRRHALNPTALVDLLATQLAATPDRGMAIAPYMSLLNDTDASGAALEVETLSSPSLSRRRREITAKDLYLPFIAEDGAQQDNLLATYGLDADEILSTEAVVQLGQLVDGWAKGSSESMQAIIKERVLRGVAALAPHVSHEDLISSRLWELALDAFDADLPAGPSNVSAISDYAWHSVFRRSSYLVPLIRTPLSKYLVRDGVDILVAARSWLEALLNYGALDAGTRASAGDVLAWLGDPRFDSALYCLPKTRSAMHLDWGLVKIPKGTFYFGDDDSGDRLGMDYDFWISRYPVTIAQYHEFIASRGYDLAGRKFWETTAQGWDWRTGKFDSIVTDSDHKEWMNRRMFGDGDHDMRRQPWDWQTQLNYSNRPVTGVNWFEACAYTAWLDERRRLDGRWETDSWLPPSDGRKYGIRLPTEAEWEKAARHSNKLTERRRFPWGDSEKDIPQRANIDNSIGHPCAVGMYPKGLSAFGVADMMGNVWEWTCSEVSADGPNDQIGPRRLKVHEDLTIADTPVMRGTSWLESRDRVRCASRFAARPDDFGDTVGLRWVFSVVTT